MFWHIVLRDVIQKKTFHDVLREINEKPNDRVNRTNILRENSLAIIYNGVSHRWSLKH